LKKLLFILLAASSLTASEKADAGTISDEDIGPEAAVRFEARYRGEVCDPRVLNCYPEAKGIPFAETRNIVQMHSSLWTPAEIVADFKRKHLGDLPQDARKKGIIVVLKTERCATKVMRLCSVTTAALEKQSTPLIREFAIYGLQLKPRDHDDPPGSLAIEKGSDSWKNEAAREYGFRQGPGATIVVLGPVNGAKIGSTDAYRLHLYEKEFIERKGRTPELEDFLRSVLRKLEKEA
jgi:hypothetical protein